ncbi:MAG: alcohol dehydrogenase catalytic domain-containing protein [Pseudomonadota bacterium]
MKDLTNYMQACVLTGPRRIALQTRPIPELPDDGILLRVDRCGICSSDIAVFEDGPDLADGLPVLGHEYVGRVVACGNAADPTLIGKRIVGWGNGIFGGIAQYRAIRPVLSTSPKRLIYPSAAAAVVPDDLPDACAVLVEPASCILRTLLGAPPEPGDDCLILGCGPFGVIAACLLRFVFGARSISVLDRHPEKLEKLSGFCDLEASYSDLSEEISGITYVFDTLGDVTSSVGDDGNPRGWAMRGCKPSAQYIAFGTPQNDQPMDVYSLISKGIRMTSPTWDNAHFPKWSTAAVMESTIKLIQSGLLPADHIIGTCVRFDDVEALQTAFSNYRRAESFTKDQVVFN